MTHDPRLMTPTADLCDAHPDRVRVVVRPFIDYGGVASFHGSIATVRVHEDYRPVRRELEKPGQGRVLVVDGGGSLTRAILGERLLNIAAENGWAGVVINGAVRDTAMTRTIPTGLRALVTIPQRGESGAADEAMVPVTFAGVTFTPGEWIWVDDDGIVVSDSQL